MEVISARFAAAIPVLPGASDLIQFILVAAVACIGIAGVRLVLDDGQCRCPVLPGSPTPN